MTHPVCSVCIANYNGMGLIDACLQSVLTQEFDRQVEIIVHDDCSMDGSADHIRTHFPDVILIESPHNVGFCIANNRMVARSSGQFVLLLNNDAALYPNALSKLLEYAESMSKPGILGLAQYDWDSGSLLDIGCLLDPFLNPLPNMDPTRRDVAMVAGACLWIPKALWENLGGFPEWFGSIGEDLYLCTLARLAGYPVQALGESGFRHRVGQSFGGGRIATGNRLATTRRRRALSECNKTFVMVLTYPAPWFQLVFPLHLVLLMLEGIILAVAKKQWGIFSEIYLAAIAATWSRRETLGNMRRHTQSQRKIGALAFSHVFRPIPRKLQLLFRHGWPRLS